MRRSTGLLIYATCVVAGVLAIEVPDWHRPVPATQIGPDGTAMVQFAETSPWRIPMPPAEALPDAPTGGPQASAVYKNVKVLTDVSQAEFDRLQQAMTAWVSPKAGCNFCHVEGDFASEANPMKTVARQHLSLTRHINTTWSAHVGASGVTCLSCHQGQPVPPETWFPSEARPTRPMIARSETWNESADTVRKFFPDNGWALYFLHDEPIRSESRTALRGDTVGSQVEVKRVYEMMMQMADGIGVNCGYCHSSRAFSDWSQSPAGRWVGYDAIRMMRDINLNFLLASGHALAQTRDLVDQNSLVIPRDAWPKAAAGLAVCASCHYGHLKPDPGAATLAHYGALGSDVNSGPIDTVAATPPVTPAQGAPTASGPGE